LRTSTLGVQPLKHDDCCAVRATEHDAVGTPKESNQGGAVVKRRFWTLRFFGPKARLPTNEFDLTGGDCEKWRHLAEWRRACM
jgi:hypothetical protein